MDVDLVLHLRLDDYERAETALGTIGLRSRLPVRAQDIIKMRMEYIKDRNLTAWSFVDFQNLFHQVDILITKDLKELKSLQHIKVAGRRLPVAGLKDLLEIKTRSGRPQDLIDIEMIRNKLHEK